MNGEGYDESRNESREGSNCNAKLFRDSLVDKVAICCDLTGYRGGGRVKEGYLLTESAPDKINTKRFGSVDGRNGNEYLDKVSVSVSISISIGIGLLK